MSELLDAARLVCAAGGEISIEMPGGHYCMDPEDFVKAVTDQDQWLADHYEVSLERVQLWKGFLEDGGQCSGTSRNGERCRSLHTEYCSEPVTFIPGESDRCPVHKEGRPQ